MQKYKIEKDVGGWKLKKVGGQRAVLVAQTKDEAIRKTRLIMHSKTALVIVHRVDGRVQDQITYTNAGRMPRKPAAAKVTKASGSRHVHDVMPPPTDPRKKKK